MVIKAIFMLVNDRFADLRLLIRYQIICFVENAFLRI